MLCLKTIDRALPLAMLLALVACTTEPRSASVPKTPAPVTPSASPRPMPSPSWPLYSEVSYGGARVKWPMRKRNTPAPPALGAVVTSSGAPLTNGRALQGGLTLPIVGGSVTSPVVLTPCMTKVRLAGRGFSRIGPATRSQKIVVVDAGHGGKGSPGAVAPDGSRESVRNLQVAELVRDDLRDEVAHVVMTRTTDRTVQLDFRVALADALRASFAISIHFNASADRSSKHPGTTTYGSVADPHGRRAAGVIFEAERAYLDTLTPRLRGGTWVSHRSAGAIYHLGSRGDYYRLLRESHVTWVLSEALFISNAPEARLLGNADVRSGLAESIATGVMRFLSTDARGSGWRVPVTRGGRDAGAALPCTDPYA